MLLDASHFPTPHLAYRGDADWARVEAFAALQAQGANDIVAQLAATPWQEVDHIDRYLAVKTAYHAAIVWRYNTAVNGGVQNGGHTVGARADRFLTPITDSTRNHDRIGVVGRMRSNPAWCAEKRVFEGGQATPASEILERYGRAALARFATEASESDTLTEYVILPGSYAEECSGSRIIRGALAKSAADDMRARLVARGRDADRVESGGEPLFLVSADEENRETMREAMFHLLAGESTTLSIYDHDFADFLLCQSPEMKRGSSAVRLVFLRAVAVWRMGYAPTVFHDSDLAGMTLGQQGFMTRRWMS